MKRLTHGTQLLSAVLLVGCSLICNSSALAQTATGVISGVVQDQSGGLVPGANVTATNVETGISQSVSTDSGGRYSVPGLIPDHYEVQAQRTGFQTVLRKGIELTVGSTVVINLILNVGEVTQTTEVTAEAPLVETTSSTLSSLVGQETIRDLPLNGRSFEQLIALQASMPQTYSQSSSLNPPGFSINGASPQANLFMIDGTEMVGTALSSNLPGGVIGVMLGVDAVQEFSLASNSSAAYGKRLGGVINIATRSGANMLHGSAFEFLRNSILDARNYFDLPTIPPYKRNQFGGSLGGRIRKDRTFFYGNYEGLRSRLSLSSVAIVPDNNARLGMIPLTTGGPLVNVGLATGVAPFLALFPIANGPNLGDGTAEFISSPSQPTGEDFFLGRIDHKISDRDSLFGRIYFTQAHQDAPNAIPNFATLTHNRDEIVTLEEKRDFSPTTLNVARFGFTRSHFIGTNVETTAIPSGLIFVPGAPLPGSINFTGGGGLAGGSLTSAGTGGTIGQNIVVNQFDFGDQVFLYRGAHSLQLGVDVQRIENNDNVPGDSWGNFSFPTLQTFLGGAPTLFLATTPGGDPTKGWRRTYVAGFIQDDYKVRKNLTLNLGLRYELMTVPTDATNRISNFHRTIINGFEVVDTSPTLGNPIYKSNHDLIDPRIGFAWDPSGNGKMSVRAGFGIFHDAGIESPFRYFFFEQQPPAYTTLTVANGPFPLGLNGGTVAPPLVAPGAREFNYKVATSLQYNLNIERQITGSSLVNIGYVGGHSDHLEDQSEVNPATPILNPTVPSGCNCDPTIFFPAGAPRLNPALGGGKLLSYGGVGFYNALEADFTQRLSHGLRFKVSYAFSKNMDNSVIVANQGSGGANAIENSFNIRGDLGLSDFDVRHNLIANFTYAIPWHGGGVPEKFLGGWQLGLINTLRSGQPFLVVDGFNQSRNQTQSVGDRPSLVPGRSNNPILGGVKRYFDPTAFVLPPPGFFGNLGRNTLIGPGLEDTDLSLAKTFSMTERLKLDFRSEFFNVLNRPNFGLPNKTVFSTTSGAISGSAGKISSTVTTSRQIQFALKLHF